MLTINIQTPHFTGCKIYHQQKWVKLENRDIRWSVPVDVTTFLSLRDVSHYRMQLEV